LAADFAVPLLCLPLAAAGAAWVDKRIGVPYPVLLVTAGALLSLSPWVRTPELSPKVVFFVFLPPLIYYAANFIAPEDLRANAWPIGLLAVGLVVVSMAAVAGVTVGIAGVPLAVAAVAGAVVAPTDPVAATSIFRRLNVPERLVTIVEGEGLINDGTALVLYVGAVDVAVSGTPRPGEAAVTLLTAPGGRRGAGPGDRLGVGLGAAAHRPAAGGDHPLAGYPLLDLRARAGRWSVGDSGNSGRRGVCGIT
jgi:NhaP-type Na+/H+ or K+/H+ antiporter